MRYSLLSRFQGALLGAAIGEILGTNNQLGGRELFRAVATEPAAQIKNERKSALGFNQRFRNTEQQPFGWGHLTMRCGQSLIGQRHEHFLKWPENRSQLWPVATVVTVPMMLFFHDSEAKLREELARALAEQLREPGGFDGLLAVGYAIAQALKEKLTPPVLIPKMIRYLHNSDKTDQQKDAKELPMVKQLQEISTLLETHASLVTATRHLSRAQPLLASANGEPTNVAIPLALYCVMSTPEDFPLSVIRATQSGCDPQLTGAIAGALSGAYNSIAGIPISWRRMLRDPNSRSATLLKALWGISSETQLLQLASQMLAAWSGMYDLSNCSSPLTCSMPISAPGVIKPR